MDPFESASSSGEWWKDAELPDFSSEDEDKLPQQLPPVILPSTETPLHFPQGAQRQDFAQDLPLTPASPSRGKSKHLKVSAKELHLRGKLKLLPAVESALPSLSSMNELVEEMFPYPSS